VKQIKHKKEKEKRKKRRNGGYATGNKEDYKAKKNLLNTIFDPQPSILLYQLLSGDGGIKKIKR
jgi:hypothetical protein